MTIFCPKLLIRTTVSANMKSLSMVPLLLLCGCDGHDLHHTFSDYSGVYATSMNEQLLLNLARLSCNEPPYFVQLGQMNAQFTFTTGLSFAPSGTSIKDTTKSGLTFGAGV